MFQENLKKKLFAVITAVNRYPLAVIFLVAAAIVNIMMIQNDGERYVTVLWTFIIGAVLSIVFKQVYEQFFNGIKHQIILQATTVLLTIGYYFMIRSIDSFNLEMEIKTAVIVFTLVMVFIWVPSIKSKVMFNETFMATFKAFFATILFTAVISIGLNLSIFAVDELLVAINYKVYSHVLNLIFTLFAPLFFLSLIPLYPGAKDVLTDEQQEQINYATTPPKLLAILLSYVVIPLTGLYTLILLIYVLLNIRGDFWTNNLLEPMLVSYAITVILVMILVSGLEDTSASLFRKVLPKILLPIVLFQLVASILKIGEMGITHGRYYVIVFGLFALITSIVFSFFPIRKSGWIVACLIILATISIIPPVDAFTASRVNQTKMLQRTLMANDMFIDGKVTPNSEITTADKRKITKTVRYLDRMQYVEKIEWLPDQIANTRVFHQTFGFDEVYGEEDVEYRGKSAYLDWEQHPVIDVDGYDRMIRLSIYHIQDIGQEEKVVPLKIHEVSYRLIEAYEDGEMHLTLSTAEKSLMHFNLTEAFDEISKNEGQLNIEEATVTEENENVRITVIVNTIDIYDTSYSGEVYVLIEKK